MKLHAFAVLLGLLASPLAAAHRELLPQPQKLEYRSGALPLKAIHITIKQPPAAEDRFAADQLAEIIGHAARVHVPVGSDAAAGPAIVLERTGAVAPLPAKDEKPGPEARESYRISITRDGGRIQSPSSAGLFYGVQTLRQMIEGAGSSAVLPAVEIHDWPVLAYRGYMMDLSHGPLLREQEIERQIDFLSRWKANQYFFYSEFSIELKGYPLINPRARYSQQQVRRIIEYGRRRHVDVVPCLEFYGHMHDLLRIEKYSDLGALPHGSDLNPRHPGLHAILEDWIGQLAELFPSPWFHVGLDEPFELEAVGTRAAGNVPPAELYADQLLAVTNMARARGKRVLFWADVHAGARIFEKYPELIAKLPKDVIPVPWYYTLSTEYEDFFKPFGQAGMAQVAAPGINIYNDIFPDYTVMMQNIDGFVGMGRKYGAIGILNTGWTDDAQTIYRMAWPGLAYGAVAGWQSQPIAHGRFFETYAAQFHGPEHAASIGKILAALTESRDLYQKTTGRQTIWSLWSDPFEPALLARAQAHRDDLRQMRLKAEDALERLLVLIGQEPDPSYLVPYRIAAEMLDYAGMKQIYACEIADFFEQISKTGMTGNAPSLYLGLEISSEDHSRTADLMDAITGLKPEYRKAWLVEATEYRLGSALGRWDAEYEFWRRFQSNVRQFIRNRKGQQAPELRSLLPPY
ncbi:MAG: beta-N-acetylhexosaminidase [Bryobacterales bacterium]|nr:beta-N-acetylhexosaminidase [Bryobacterales bacterium]